MKRIIAAAVMTLTAAVGAVAIAEPAFAVNYCNASATKETKYWEEAYGYYLGTTAPVYAGSVACYMNYGATGNGVRALQNALNSCYSAGLTVDGVLGTNTTNAIKAVQRANNITADGGWGPQTRAVLKFRTHTDHYGNTHCSPLR
jgi:lysozyme family protein